MSEVACGSEASGAAPSLPAAKNQGPSWGLRLHRCCGRRRRTGNRRSSRRGPGADPGRALVPASARLPRSLSRPPHAPLWRRHHLQTALFLIFGRAGNPTVKGSLLSSSLIRAWHYCARSLWLCRSCVSDANCSQRLSSCISIFDCHAGTERGRRTSRLTRGLSTCTRPGGAPACSPRDHQPLRGYVAGSGGWGRNASTTNP